MEDHGNDYARDKSELANGACMGLETGANACVAPSVQRILLSLYI